MNNVCLIGEATAEMELDDRSTGRLDLMVPEWVKNDEGDWGWSAFRVGVEVHGKQAAAFADRIASGVRVAVTGRLAASGKVIAHSVELAPA